MSDVVDFLEHMGRDAQMHGAAPADIAQAVAQAGLDTELQQAIVARDKDRLASLLGSQPFCGVMIPGKEDDGEEERKDDEDDWQKGPEPDSDMASSHARLSDAA